MRLLVIDTAAKSERESDYETAVETSHWRRSSTTTLFESPGGVRFLAGSIQESTSYTYLEPDFDIMDQTGALVWETHPEPDKTRSSSSVLFEGLFIARAAEFVTVAELQMARREHDDNPWSVDADDKLSYDVCRRLIAHLEGGDGRPTTAAEYALLLMVVAPDRLAIDLDREEIERLADLTGREGQYTEVELSPELEAAIRGAEKLHAAILVANGSVVAENRVRTALASIENLIDDMAAAARAELKQKFSRQGGTGHPCVVVSA